MKSSSFKQPHNYRCFAQYYDRLMSPQRYATWAKMIADMVRKYKVKKGLCLDLACGTGAISAILDQQGFEVIGIDSSADMLAIAKNKRQGMKLIHADLRNFTIRGKKAGFAVSLYDSLNYLLTKADLLKAFKQINQNLAPCALFFFDINTTEHVKNASQFSPNIYEDDEVYIVFRYGKKKTLWSLTIDFFCKAKINWVFFREEHFERGYDEKDIIPLLAKSNFRLLEVQKEYKVGKDNKKYLSRLYFVALKP